MNRKILIGIVVILGIIVILETDYILKIRQKPVPRRAITITRPATLKSYPVYREQDPFVEMERLQQKINRVFDDRFFKASRMKKDMMVKPIFQRQTGLIEEDGKYLLSLELPGVDKKAINIEIKGRSLIVFGERKKEETKEAEGFAQEELSYGSFYQRVLLPPDALVKNITSEYKSGVLTVTIPKEARKKCPREKIKVLVK
ncbi:MAG: Hsp20/alpha crystallin family protein [Candidatus Omnitrophota bacterium]